MTDDTYSDVKTGMAIEHAVQKKKLKTKLLKVAVLMVVGMTIYELLKQLIFPEITIWESHIVTILFSTVCATVAAYFIFQEYFRLMAALLVKNQESERLRQELEETVQQLQRAISQVKTLKGLLPICSSCKSIRDDRGYWNKTEKYIKDHSDADLTHSICPECMKRLYPEEYDEIYR